MAEGMSYKKAQEFRQSDIVRDYIIQEYKDGCSLGCIHKAATIRFGIPISYYFVKRIVLKYTGVLQVSKY